MQRKFLEDLGIEKEYVDKIMSENGKDINREKEKTEALQLQLNAVNNQLKSFEGVDVTQLNTKISELTTQLNTSKAEYECKIAERDFNDLLNKKATEYKVRELKAVKPFLDLEALKNSKNQENDIDAAFKQLTSDENRSFLFENSKPIPKFTSVTEGINQNSTTNNAQMNEALRNIFKNT